MIDQPGPEVEACGITCSVDGKALLGDVDLRVGKGELVGLIGPNGAGKTTLLRVLAGVMQRQAGTVLLQGRDLDSLSAREIASILALVPQSPPLTHGFHAFELVMMGRYPHLRRFAVEGAADREVVLEAMRMTETEEFADRTLDSLSGGERQRVFLARSLAQGADILLLDEPTSNLDVLHQLKFLDLVRGFVNEGLTVIAAIHDLSLAARYCDRLLVLAGGKVLSEGEPPAVLTPEVLAASFGIEAVVYPDPVSGCPAVSAVRPAG